MPKSSTAMRDPGVAQPRQPFGDAPLVDQQRVFGDLDGDPRRIDARPRRSRRAAIARSPVARNSCGSRLIDSFRPLSGPSHTAALRSAFFWTSRERRSARPAAAARANNSSADAAIDDRASASAPTIAAGARLDQRLELDARFAHARSPIRASGRTRAAGARHCPIGSPASPTLTVAFQHEHGRLTRHEDLGSAASAAPETGQ